MNTWQKIFILGIIAIVAGFTGFIVDGKWALGDISSIKNITVSEFREISESKDVQLIDVRSEREFSLGHIPDAVSCPINEINKDTISRFDKTKPTVVYCSTTTCSLAEESGMKLSKLGFVEIYVLVDGIEGYQGALSESDEFCVVSSEATSNMDLKNLSVVLTLGLIDGINPCAIAVIVFLLGYLITFAGKRSRLWITGIIYIVTTFVVYFVIGLVFVKSIEQLLGNQYYAVISLTLNTVLGVILIFAGIINLKDFFWFGKGLFLGISKGAFPKIQKLAMVASYPLVALLAVMVTLFEAPCSLPLYLGTSKLIADSASSLATTAGYLSIYNLMFVVPLIVVLVIIGVTSNMVAVKEFEHRGKRWLKLIMGAILVMLGVILLF